MTDTINRDKNCSYGFDFFIERTTSDLNNETLTYNEHKVGKNSRKWDVTCSNIKSVNTGLFFTATSGSKLSKKR
jgi:hypothetical protein